MKMKMKMKKMMMTKKAEEIWNSLQKKKKGLTKRNLK